MSTVEDMTSGYMQFLQNGASGRALSSSMLLDDVYVHWCSLWMLSVFIDSGIERKRDTGAASVPVLGSSLPLPADRANALGGNSAVVDLQPGSAFSASDSSPASPIVSSTPEGADPVLTARDQPSGDESMFEMEPDSAFPSNSSSSLADASSNCERAAPMQSDVLVDQSLDTAELFAQKILRRGLRLSAGLPYGEGNNSRSNKRKRLKKRSKPAAEAGEMDLQPDSTLSGSGIVPYCHCATLHMSCL